MALSSAPAQSSWPVILYVVTVDWWFVLHRMHIAAAARDAGWRVVVATHEVAHGADLRAAGFEVIPVGIHRSSMSPLRAAIDIARLRAAYRRVRPDLVHHLAIRPSMLGSVAAALTATKPVVNNLTGMGTVFIDPAPATTRIVRRAILSAFRIAFNRAGTMTIVENLDDMALLVDQAHVQPRRVAVIPSVGVDLDRFPSMPPPDGPPVVTLAARMVEPKGVAEFVEAARLLARRGVPVRMQLVGGPDPANPQSIGEAQLRRWHAEGCVEWLGRRTDMPDVWAASSIAVLPSYREGVPVSLLEAAATARPVVTTDVPGCRDVVDDGVTGMLVQPRRPDELAAAIEHMVADPARRAAMGAAGRRLVEEQFSARRVARTTVDLYRRMMGDM